MSSCMVKKQENPACVGVLVNMDLADSGTGATFSLHDDTILICHSNDAVLYRQSVEFIQYNKKALKNGRMEVIDDPATIDSKTRLHRFYVFSKSQKVGLMYDSLGKEAKGTAFNIDSLLAQNPIFKGGTTEFDERTALSSKSKTKDGLVLEKYVYKAKPDPSHPDTVCFFYDRKWKSEIPYTLSKSVDSLKKMKLVRVNLIYNPATRGGDALGNLPARGLDVKLFKPTLKGNEQREINQAFQAYQREKK